MTSHRCHRPVFLLQALLIAAPLIVLSGIALYSQRQDKASIEQDARDRARMLAPELALRWGQSLGNMLADPPAQELPRGLVINRQILFPTDYAPLPAPPDWPEKLTPKQRELWRTAEEALFQRRDPIAAGNVLTALEAAGLPEAASANAQFSSLLLESRKGGTRNPAQRFTDLARRYPRVRTEAGTPLADLALIQALHYTPAGSVPSLLSAELSGRVRSYPSFLTPELLAAAERAEIGGNSRLKDGWLADEEMRSLLRSFLRHPMEPGRSGEIWFEAHGQRFLALCGPWISTVTHVTLIPSQWLEQAFLSALRVDRDRIPSYAGVTIQIGDRYWIFADQKVPVQDFGQPPVDVLASAPGKLEARSKIGLPAVALRDGLLRLAPQALPMIRGLPNSPDIHTILPASFLSAHSFSIRLTLAQPDLLYARYRQRLWLAAGLILAAAAAAGIGLASAWRAFRRQLRLAEMTSNFISSVSHELRAPIASVQLMAESLDQGRITESERQKGYFRLIAQECRRLSSLVENVLDFSRIQEGRKRYEFEPIDLAALVRQTVTLMGPIAEARQVCLVMDEPPSRHADFQPCWDGQALQQALVNLLDNAIKHSPEGSMVRVEWHAVRAGTKSMIHLTIEDQGPGIPVEQQQRIFEPFYRRGSELRRETKGIGIGLSIVKHVAEAHGGRVLVDSVVNHGSRFTIELPLTTTPQVSADQRQR